jgi:CheY-like chemotaxis protein
MRNANVLVVEDDDTIRRLLVDYLKQHSDVSVEGARDGVEALHFITTRPYRVVVLDVMMPKMSGVDVLESLHAMLADPSVKTLDALPAVVVMTATGTATLPTGVLEHRFPETVRAVFRKPLDMIALAELVERLLQEAPAATNS